MHNTVSIGWRSNRGRPWRQHQRQVRFSTVKGGEGPSSSSQVSRSPSSVLPSHDFSRTQQRSRLKCKEKLGFAIPVGHFQTVQAGHGHAHCGHGDKPPGEAPPTPSMALVAQLPPCGLQWVSVWDSHTSMRRSL